MVDRARRRVVAGYALREQLGEDELRTTYRASMAGRVEHLHVFRELAGPADQEARHRALQQALSIPPHPRILHVITVGREESLVYATTEPFAGTSLQAFTLGERLTGLPIGAALWVARGALAALAHLHAQPIAASEPLGPRAPAKETRPFVLGRVTPGELLGGEDGAVKLDILPGLCRPRPKGELYAESAAPLGFESPEQIRGEPLDGRSDLFSLGATLASLLLGHAVLVGPNMFETYQRILQADARVPKLLSALRPKLQTLVGRALQRDPAARYPSAAEFDAAIAHAGAVLGVEVSAAVLMAALSAG